MSEKQDRTAGRPHSQLLDSDQFQRALARMALEIIEDTEGAEPLALVGMQTRGVYLARRLAKLIKKNADRDVPVGVLDVTFYRDDFRNLASMPEVKPTEIPFEVDGRTLVLVDDVIFTGRTVRAALDCLMDFGRPHGIRLAVLVDRGHRQLPIRPDYVAEEITTAANEEILVHMKEEDGEDAVYLVDAPA